MATQIKPETRNVYAQNEAGEGPHPGPGTGTGTGRGLFVMEFVLRVLGIAATLAAVIAMVTAKQTETVPVQLAPNTPPIFVPVPAKYHYSPAFVYFVVANAVACGYTLLSIIVSVAKLKGSTSSVVSALLLSITDLVMVALISSAASAAAAIGYVGWKGNSHSRWNKICNIYDKYCHHVAGALGVSFFGLAVFMILTLLSLYTLYKHTRLRR